MALAPTPHNPENTGTVYETKTGSNSARRGPLRFQEGLKSDPSVAPEFTKGQQQGYKTPAGRPNHNENVYEKPAAETMQERSHLGSVAWIDSNDMLSDFASGAFADYQKNEWQNVVRDGGHYMRESPAVIKG